MRTYATAKDLPDGLKVKGDVDTHLAYASALVEGYTRTALYVTDEGGCPTDQDVQEAFKVAVVTQVAAWAALGIDPALGAAGVTKDPQVTTKAIGSASISYAASSVTSRSADDLVAAVSHLAPTAAALLDAAVRDRRIWVTG